MSDIIDTKTITLHGVNVKVEYLIDYDAGKPWENAEGHGPVREGPRHREGGSNKRPGERPLNRPDRNGCQYYYDWQAAMKMAHADGWNAKPYEAPNRALRAVQADFDFLSAWLNDKWEYVGVRVVILDKDDNETDDEESCFGFETWDDYHHTAAREMADALVRSHVDKTKREFSQRMREARERKYWASRDVLTTA